MKHHTMLLDCTLRDGAYLLDKKFGAPLITNDGVCATCC